MWTFIANNIGTILAVIGALSTVALVVVIALVGVPALAALGYVVGAAKAAFQFLRTPVGQVVGIALLCVACLFAGDMIGTRRESAKCRAAELAAELEAIKRDSDINRAATDGALHIAEELAAEASRLEQKVKDYEDELAKRPRAAACISTADDIKRLRAIAE